MNAPTHRFVRDTAGIALSQYVARVMMLARGWAAAAALGPHGYGAWNALNLIFDYGSYASLGAVQGLDVELPAAVRAGERDRARRLMAAAWCVVLAGGAAYAVSVLALLAWAPRPEVASHAGLAALMLIAALLQLLFFYLASSLRAHGRFRSVSVAQGVQAVVGAGLGFAAVWRFGLLGLLLGWLAGTLVALAGMRRAAPEAPLAPAHPREGIGIARAGFPIFAFFATSLVLRSADRLALVRFGAAEALGLYSLGLMVAGSLLYLPESVSYVLFPRIAAAREIPADRDRVRAETLRVQRAVTLVMPIVVGIVIVWVGPAIAWLLPSYRDGIPAVQLLAVAALVLSTSTVPSYYLLASGRPLLLLGLGALAAAANVTLVFAVAVRWPEPVPVAIAATIGYFVFAVVILARAARDLGGGAAERVRLVLASVFPAAWGATLALILAQRMPEAWAALGATALFAIGYAPVLGLMGRGIGLRGVLSGVLGRAAGESAPR